MQLLDCKTSNYLGVAQDRRYLTIGHSKRTFQRSSRLSNARRSRTSLLPFFNSLDFYNFELTHILGHFFPLSKQGAIVVLADRDRVKGEAVAADLDAQ